MIDKLRVKVVAGVLVVFLIGMVIGALGTSLFIARRARQLAEGSNTVRKTWFFRRLDHQLRLTDAQKPAVREVLEQSEEEVRVLLSQSLKEFSDLMLRRNDALKPLLTPEQQEKLDAMSQRMHRFLPENLSTTEPAPTPGQ